MLPSLYGPKIFRASPEKDFFDTIDPYRKFAPFTTTAVSPFPASPLGAA
jgi:hypothetical protein